MQALNALKACAVKWYVFNPGDYYSATLGLTDAQDLCYRQLIDAYYLREGPLPANPQECLRMLRTKTKKVKILQSVLEQFFLLESDGWHHKRIDNEITRYTQGQPAREQKKAEYRQRRQRFNTERKALYQTLKAAGCTVKWNAPMLELRQLAARMGLESAARRAFEQAMSQTTGNSVPSAFPVDTAEVNVKTIPLPDTANANRHEPITNNHKEHVNVFLGTRSESVCVGGETDSQTAEAVAAAARRAGLAYANARDAALLALLDAGAVLADFEVAATEANAAGKGWAYMLGIVRNRIADQSRHAKQAQEGPKSGRGQPIGEWLRALDVQPTKTAQNDDGNN